MRTKIKMLPIRPFRAFQPKLTIATARRRKAFTAYMLPTGCKLFILHDLNTVSEDELKQKQG